MSVPDTPSAYDTEMPPYHFGCTHFGTCLVHAAGTAVQEPTPAIFPWKLDFRHFKKTHYNVES